MRGPLLLIACMSLSACTSSLRPVQMSLPAAGSTQSTGISETRPSGCSGARPVNNARQELAWFSCALATRAETNLTQSLSLANRTEWRDIPLIGAAATVAGLLLFGSRDAGNALTAGTQEAIEITGFAAAGFGAFANYLSPQTARRLLRQGARGHHCMAVQANVILSLWDGVEARKNARDALSANVADLGAMIATADPDTPGLARFIAARDAATRAIALYDHHRNQLQLSPTYLGETAWNFGIDLIQASDRQPVDVAALVESISQQANSIARFGVATEGAPAQTPGATGPAVAGAPLPPPTLETLARQVAQETAQLLAGLPNIEALVLGFDRCASTALANANPTVTRVQRAGVE